MHVAGEFHARRDFPRARSLTIPPVHRGELHRCSQPASQPVLRAALGPDDAPRFGLCALRSRISRYTYATRDLLPMIMRGWKYALQEEEEEVEDVEAEARRGNGGGGGRGGERGGRRG